MIPANIKDGTQTSAFRLSIKKFTKKDFHTQYEVFLEREEYYGFKMTFIHSSSRLLKIR